MHQCPWFPVSTLRSSGPQLSTFSFSSGFKFHPSSFDSRPGRAASPRRPPSVPQPIQTQLPVAPNCQKPPAKAEVRRRRQLSAFRSPSLPPPAPRPSPPGRADPARFRPSPSDFFRSSAFGIRISPPPLCPPPFAGRGGRHQTRSPQRGRDIIARVSATCGAAGRRHPG